MGRKSILLACIASAVLGAACDYDAKSAGQKPQSHNQDTGNTLLEQIERSEDQPLRVAVNEEPPLKIVEAKIKVIPGPQFTELTGTATDFSLISSVPELTLVNSSGKTITEFTIILRNPKLQAGRSLLQRKVSVPSGQTYVVRRDHFLTPGVAPGDHKSTGGGRAPGLTAMESENYWLTFGERSDLFVTVYKVGFDDGSSWVLKEGGEIR